MPAHVKKIFKNIFGTVKRDEVSQRGQCLKCHVVPFFSLDETEAQNVLGYLKRNRLKVNETVGDMGQGLTPYLLKCTFFALPVFRGIWFRLKMQSQSICGLLRCFKGLMM